MSILNPFLLLLLITKNLGLFKLCFCWVGRYFWERTSTRGEIPKNSVTSSEVSTLFIDFLQNQFSSSNSVLQKKLVELRQKLGNHCYKAKEVTKEAMGNRSAKSDVIQDNFITIAARNAKQEQSIGFLKGELTELKV